MTHSGIPKRFRLKNHINSLGLPIEQFHVIEVEIPANLPAFEKDAFQRDFVKDYILDNFPSDSFLLSGDVDEIPSRESVSRAIDTLEQNDVEFIHFAQEMCVGYLNNAERTRRLLSYLGEYPGFQGRDRRWLGTTMTRVRNLNQLTITELRDPARKEFGARLSNGGWHFSYVGGGIQTEVVSRIVNKLQASPHQEFLHLARPELISKRLSKGKDILGRRGVRFEVRDSKTFLPPEILDDNRFQKVIREK
jgi:beta-1,4-mannosyl-glycoprotein beta-1,4-N-acetylglucosaminyltransferase